ncbi:MAG: DUF484 family protein [Burkholderiaceae bacterium]|nr:DUF484 family protein [Burkholderiaceae bacterium]MCO5104196.1 DUF484 family protein [Burkholderiaceae bacterium]
MSQSAPMSPITEDDIAHFLANTPEFFERHAEVLASVQIASAHGQRAVSLQERQAEMLREKIKALEQRVMEMVRNSHDNEAIAAKVHAWGCELQRVQQPAALPQAVVCGIEKHFDVPQTAIRVWDVAPEHAEHDFAQDASDDVRAFASSLTMPFCGPNLGFEPTSWLPRVAVEEGDSLAAQSLALLPLREGPIDSATPAFGLLVLGSPDAQRFEATMGTEFLSRMAELASAALQRLK